MRGGLVRITVADDKLAFDIQPDTAKKKKPGKKGKSGGGKKDAPALVE